jgi:signal transduction histidine kinase
MEKVYFEPAGRLLMSIGRDLIKDIPAALVELVKNSYDADATKVNIEYNKTDKGLIITVRDNGHGMSYETVVNSWMSPATNYKLKRKKSPNGRIYQGRKGIGRYAVSLLGNKLKLLTIKNGKKTTATFDWDAFENADRLRDVPVEISVQNTHEENKTELVIINDYSSLKASDREILTESDALKIQKELSKLVSSQMDFDIEVSYINFFDDDKLNITRGIEQYASEKFFHYRLVGYVNENFDYKFYYKNTYNNEEKEFNGNFLEEGKNKKDFNLTRCGNILIDYKVYDKDSEGIEMITNFINGSGNVTPLSNRETKNLLIDNSGISIFRNSFRIRPYGDKGFDWLNLDSQRVQKTTNVGFDQINGRIEIASEEISGLKEKSARDGLYENENYFTLQKIADLTLDILEKERLNYRQSKKKSVKKTNVEKLFDFSTTGSKIEKQIKHTFEKIEKNPHQSQQYFSDLQDKVNAEIIKLEKEKQETFEEIKEEVAIYQKHTTLGNVINVVLHEGRKPLTWYSHTIPKLIRKFNKIAKNNKQLVDVMNDSVDSLRKLKEEADRLGRFFKRLDPLSSTRRKNAKLINIKQKIENIFEIFSDYAGEKNIELFYQCDENVEMLLVEEDIYMALTNIIENSIFWVDFTEKENKKVSVIVEKEEDSLIIDIVDNGLGLSEEDIKSGVIFVPGYSGKKNVVEQNGTGLGLAIAGEAISRNDGVLEAIKSNNGAHFRIKFHEEGQVDDRI